MGVQGLVVPVLSRVSTARACVCVCVCVFTLSLATPLMMSMSGLVIRLSEGVSKSEHFAGVKGTRCHHNPSVYNLTSTRLMTNPMN